MVGALHGNTNGHATLRDEGESWCLEAHTSWKMMCVLAHRYTIPFGECQNTTPRCCREMTRRKRASSAIKIASYRTRPGSVLTAIIKRYDLQHVLTGSKSEKP